MKNVALVLSGGGARGYAHIGAIKVLEQNGFQITSIAGTSIGALIGGIYATGQLKNFEEWITSLDIRQLFKLTDFSFSRQGFVKGKKIFDKIKEIVPNCNIEDLPFPFCAIATDIIDGSEFVFTKGDLFDAIRASVSIPTLFLPHVIAGRNFVDGALLNPVPVDRIKRTDSDILIVVDVNASVRYGTVKVENEQLHSGRYYRTIMKIKDKLRINAQVRKPDKISIFNMTNKSIGIMIHKISELTVAKHRPDLLIPISMDSFNFYEFYKAGEIIAEGEKATLEALKNFHS